MKKSLLIQCALMVLFTLVLLWTVPATAADAAKHVYVCGCCEMVSDQPGKAPCGMPAGCNKPCCAKQPAAAK